MFCLSGLLRGWLDKLAPFYEEGSELRKKVLHVISSSFDVFFSSYIQNVFYLQRLSMSFWWEQIQHKLKRYDEGEMNNLHHSLRNVTDKFTNNTGLYIHIVVWLQRYTGVLSICACVVIVIPGGL